jgi:methenyltetrahydromethanopterin cyclohydrolase
VDDLKLVLDRLPKGSSILWGGIDLGGEIPAGMVYLTFPPQALMDEVTAYCTAKGLTLTSLKPQ